MMGDNTDAAFANHGLRKPSAFLLDCAYGAAALRQWGVLADDVLRIFPQHLPRPAPIEHPNTYRSRPEYNTTAEDRTSRRRNDGDDRSSVMSDETVTGGHHHSALSDDTVIDGPDKFDAMCTVLTGLYKAGIGKCVEPSGADVSRWINTDGAGI